MTGVDAHQTPTSTAPSAHCALYISQRVQMIINDVKASLTGCSDCSPSTFSRRSSDDYESVTLKPGETSEVAFT